MIKSLRITAGAALLLFGAIFFVLPGTVLFLLAGLLLLSMELPQARALLRRCQKSMDKGARHLDRLLLSRKLRR
ncbi:PGPGW domain-containing protein [Aliiglaciecola sp. CAU 1673]|uniref:PGPGW domain-containing protein n=1 Tax=Aliiglaciecola sp. CAU 1673 TaxID=3032595 RepID=UPI0023D9A859|nr:PGPGW domain-containing protein [Aliiglaciecola sp. CAU 1673]MDF2177728.1 PGPGW domain-containing protein [Aliiglaciecola sp. CAU 1673]